MNPAVGTRTFPALTLQTDSLAFSRYNGRRLPLRPFPKLILDHAAVSIQQATPQLQFVSFTEMTITLTVLNTRALDRCRIRYRSTGLDVWPTMG